MFPFFKKLFGEYNFEPLIKNINSLEPELEKVTDEGLKNRSLDLKKTIQNDGNLEDALAEAFAVVREAARRTLKQRHFDVQLIGGIVLHQGRIAEMLTGEGKTLAATAPAYLNALTGKGVHIVTVNDYLARRDAVWMGQIYYLLGLSVGCLTHEGAFLYDPSYTQESQNSLIRSRLPEGQIKIQDDNSSSKINEKDKERDALGGFKVVQDFLRPISRKEAYLADITYGTNHEFGFDYLRDNLTYDITQQVQSQRHYYAIIDEIDSILIDEARTPLIIAAPDAESSDFYRVFAKVVSQLSPDEDYLVDEKLKSVSITDQGIDKVEKILKLEDLYGPANLRLVHYLEESLKAKALFHKDKQYIIENGQIIIIDEFTGRKMYGRRYSGGLHQAIEAKESGKGESVKIQQESRTFAQITIQNYFRLYEKISGMTGTAQTSAEEFHKVYNLEVVSVPPNKPMVREDKSDVIYKNLEAKHQAVVDEVKKRHFEGQPILLGTTSITNNEIVSVLLNQAGIPHEVLNAKNHEREGAIIAQAGKSGAVTVATNMAGRGVDIILGGNPPDAKEAEKIKELGGLYVIGTERHEARRIDNQLRGRSGRQGDPGTSRFFLSLEDDLLRIFGGGRIKSLMEKFNLPEDQPIESKMVSRAVNEAQKKVEGFNFDARKQLLEYDDILNKQRNLIYKKRQALLTRVSAEQIDLRELMKEAIPDIDEEKLNKLEQLEVDSKKRIGVNVLVVLDMLWMSHLENMEALREAVGMRAYAQHEPLVEYRRESHILFKDLFVNFGNYVKENFDRILEISRKPVVQQPEDHTQPESVNKKIGLSAEAPRSGAKVGRNDPCWCGSGKKYKKCHGK